MNILSRSKVGSEPMLIYVDMTSVLSITFQNFFPTLLVLRDRAS